ncbi:hypothetical protein A6A08_14510 [Nocardiopsis sp. TSRI0078]|uniref:hypothetical protein n=1 Tax=unclassified Nocardiopsis TaxID=2649073 RepID=UPI00093A829F|nr:hypothetical protein [Nocardiopsis sp. TSRI0078]OKI13499.1 hypothetical protein A6A08_14510 [Nocardiopsis sp. TSRI0078]
MTGEDPRSTPAGPARLALPAVHPQGEPGAVALAVDHVLASSLVPVPLVPAMCAAMAYPLLRGRV